MATSRHAQPGLIVTADDLGLDERVNEGIVEACRSGIVTSVSLQANGPAAEHAVELIRKVPGVEIGIHLSLVEGLSLRGRPGTTTDADAYFPGRLCLHRDWRRFLAAFSRRRVDLHELEEELTLQLERFRGWFGRIPFANATQHLHVLPGVSALFVRLAERFQIGAVRVPSSPTRPGRPRWLQGSVLSALSLPLRRRLRSHRIATTDHFSGFGESGSLTELEFSRMVESAKPGVTEIVTHPGRESAWLRRCLPGTYHRAWSWEGELAAVTSPRVRDEIARRGLRLTRFEALA